MKLRHSVSATRSTRAALAEKPGTGGVFLAALLALTLSTGPAAAQSVLDNWSSVKVPPAPVAKPVTLDPATTALFVMDFNKNTCTTQRRARCVTALPHVKHLLDMARAAGVMVIHTYGPNMKRDDFVPALAPQRDEAVYQMNSNKFYLTNIEQVLHNHNIDTVVLTGTSADGAVLATALGAAQRTFHVVVPVDTMPADTAYEEQFTAWAISGAPMLRNRSVLTRSDLVKFTGGKGK